MLRNLIIASLPLLAVACSDQPGTITATVYGEEFIEEGIPAEVFGDGWSVAFDKFVVSIGGAAAGGGDRQAGDPSFFFVDLAQASGGEGYPLATFDARLGTAARKLLGRT